MVKEPDRYLNTALVAANHERKRILDALGKQLDQATSVQEMLDPGNSYIKGQVSALRRAINKIKGG